MTADNLFSIYQICQILASSKPPSPEDTQTIQAMLEDWNDYQRVTDADVAWVKRTLNIPHYCRCSPGYGNKFLVVILPSEPSKIILDFTLDNYRRAIIPWG